MSTTVNTVCQAMEAWAPSTLAYDWDSVGLQIGESGREVTRVVTCLTVTEDVVRRAERWGAEMIVAHHPILFRPLKRLQTDDVHTRLCLRIAHAGIACFAAHTNLDVVPGGVNSLLAETLALQDVTPLVSSSEAGQVKLVVFVPESHCDGVREALCQAGAGEIGAYSGCSFRTPGTGTFRPGATATPFSGSVGALSEEPEERLEVLVTRPRLHHVLAALQATHPYEEPAYDVVCLENRDPRFGLGARGTLEKAVTLRNFAETVRQALGLSHVRMVGPPGRKVRRVAVCGGAGGGEIGRMPGDIDVYVTGDLKYHEADDARARGLSLIDAGHVGTERAIATRIADYLRGSVAGIQVKAVLEEEIFVPITAS